MQFFDYPALKQKALAEAHKLHQEWLVQHFDGVDQEALKGAYGQPESPYDSQIDSDDAAEQELKEMLLKGSITPDEVDYVLADLMFLQMKKQTRQQWSSPNLLVDDLLLHRNLTTQPTALAAIEDSKPFDALIPAYLKHLKTEKESRTDEWLHRVEVQLIECHELMGFPLLNEVNHELADLYRERLLVLPKQRNKGKYKGLTLIQLQDLEIPESDRLSGTSMNNRLSTVNRYVRWLQRRGDMATNPFDGLKIKSTKKQHYDYFTEQDLSRILQTMLFDPDSDYFKTYGKKSYWWLIVLAIFTGARIGELLQLTVKDIRVSDSGIYFFHINDDDGKTVKTGNAVREVPIHSQLLKLGLLEYWYELKAKDPESRLLPSAKIGKCKVSGPMSNWFREKFRDRYFPDMKRDKKVFHSFRKTFIHYAMENLEGDNIAVMQLVVGHETGFKDLMGMTAIYKRDFSIERKLQCVEAFKLSFFTEKNNSLLTSAGWRRLSLP